MIGITWPIPPEIDDAELERRLFAPAGFNKPPARIMLDWTHIHAELRRRGVTLRLLWEEYRAEQPDGYGYSRFRDLYVAWRRGLSATMRQCRVAKKCRKSARSRTCCHLIWEYPRQWKKPGLSARP